MPCNNEIFKCTKCGDCCKGYGGTYVTEKDIEAIAAFINEQPAAFIKKYCQKSGRRLVLAQDSTKYCIFWNHICTIHPVKPRMCRAWPYIESVLKHIENWQIMGASCPGIRTDASEDQIRECIQDEIKKMKAGGS